MNNYTLYLLDYEREEYPCHGAIGYGQAPIVINTVTCCNCYKASFKDFPVEGQTAKRDFRERRKSGKSFVFLSSL